MPSDLAQALIRPSNRYQLHTPTPKQRAAEFARRHRREVLFGGGAGGGKSDLLLRAALEYAENPRYSAIIMRRTFAQLTKEGGLIPRSHEWLAGTDAHWRGDERKWIFPSGATLEFGHCQRENDKYDYDGSEFQFVGFDQLEQFSQAIYTYLGFSRARRGPGDPPLCTMSTANPGGVGGPFIKARFGVGHDSNGKPFTLHPEAQARRIFIRSLLADNPHLIREEYIEGLQELDALERQRLLEGDWDSIETGDMFRSTWFPLVDLPTVPASVRFWDLASTKPSKKSPDPDWTRGCKLGSSVGRSCIHGFRSIRDEAPGVWAFVVATARTDGPGIIQVFEQEPGASGKQAAQAMRERLLAHGIPCRFVPSSQSKAVRATPLANDASEGLVDVVASGEGVDEFLLEVDRFRKDDSGVGHDDTIDSAAGALNHAGGHGIGWGGILAGTRARRDARSGAEASA